MAPSPTVSQERDTPVDMQTSETSPATSYHCLSILDFMSYAFSGPAAMNAQEKKLMTADLNTQEGVDEFIEALMSLRPSIETGPSREKFLERIASLPADRQSEAKAAIIYASESFNIPRRKLLAQIVEGVKADKEMQQRVGKSAFLDFLEQCDILAKTYRPISSHTEKCLEAIEHCWGMRIANQYMSMGDSALEEMMTIASHVSHSVAVMYLDAEILARKERVANGSKGHIPTGHGITISDAKSARAKIVGKWKVPVLSKSLLAKYNLRISKEDGLLKSVAESESDDEDDVEDEGQEQQSDGGCTKTHGDQEQTGQRGDDEINTDVSMQSSIKRSFEQPEDAQKSEKRARLSTNATEESASEAFLADLKAFLDQAREEEGKMDEAEHAVRQSSQEITK